MKHTLEFRGWNYEKFYIGDASLVEENEWNANVKYVVDKELSDELIYDYACECGAKLFPKSHIGVYLDMWHFELLEGHVDVWPDHITFTVYLDDRNCCTANDGDTKYLCLFDVKVFWDGKELNDMVEI